MPNIELARLGFILLPALGVLFIQWRWSQGPATTLYAIARMVLQLLAIGYILTFIFASDRIEIVLSVLTIMLVAASWISLRPIAEQRKQLILPALTSIALVNAVLLGLVVIGVINQQPWYQANVIIPLAGMIFAAGMNSISLFGERFFAELQDNKKEHEARNLAYHATLIPSINSLFAVGLVSLPGMMTGQILSGVSPLVAVRYQIMVMLMLLAASGLTAALFYKLIAKRRP